MGKITFVEHDGTKHVVEFEAGASLKDIAVDNAVPGIDADCGGECACGTCHMIVAAEWFDKTGGTTGGDEEQMLSMTPERSQTSRLGCQVQTTEAMDGITVYLPEFQM